MEKKVISDRSLKKSLIFAAALSAVALPCSAMSMDLPGQGRTIQPVGIPLAEELFQYQIIALGLEELGYEVEATSRVQTPIVLLIGR